MPPPPPPEVTRFYHHTHAHGLVAIEDYSHPDTDYALSSSATGSMPSLVWPGSPASTTDSGHGDQ